MAFPKHPRRKSAVKIEEIYPETLKALLNPRPGLASRIFEEVRAGDGFGELIRNGVPDVRVRQFFLMIQSVLINDWALSRPDLDFGPSSRALEPKPDASFFAFEKKVQNKLTALSRLLEDPRAKKLILDWSTYDEHLAGPAASLVRKTKKIREACDVSSFTGATKTVVDSLNEMISATQEASKNALILEPAEYRTIKKSVRGRRNFVLIYAATLTERLFGDRYPTFLMRFFNTREVRSLFPKEPILGVEAIETKLRRLAGRIPGIKKKQNSAEKLALQSPSLE